MKLQFIIDNMLPRDLAELLVAQGYEAQTASRLKLGSNADESIMQYADKIGAVVIFKDADFLPMSQNQAKGQFIHIKLGNTSTQQLLRRFQHQLPNILHALESGEKVIEVR